MLMLGRYVSDTTERCMTITRSGWTTIMVDSCTPLIATATSLYTIGSATAVYNGSHLAFSAAREVDGAGFMAQVAAGVDNSFEFNVSKLTSSSDEGVLVTVLETIDNVPYVIGGGRLQFGPKQRINFRSTGNNVSLLFTGPFNMVELAQVCTKYPKSVQHTYLVDVCDEDKDKYRFGFNGMEKDNELKGVGNSLDFGARIYDSRIGKFLSLDPDMEKYTFQSPYVYANNTPIQAIDREGKGAGYAALLHLAKQLKSTVAVGTSASVSLGVGFSAAAGFAVDPKGNVALFTTASVGSIENTVLDIDKVGLGANVNLTASILPFKDVSAISGLGFNVGASVYSPKAVGGGISADFSISSNGSNQGVSFQGFTGSVGLGTPGGSVGIGGIQATNAILLSGKDYKTIFDSDWDKQGVNTATNWDRSLNNNNMNNPSGFWDYTGKEVTFSKVEGQENTYSLNIKLNYSYKTSTKGAKEGQKNVNVSQTIETGVTVSKTDQFTYQSSDLK